MAFNTSCRCPDQLLALGDFVRAAQDDTGVSAEAGQKRFRTQWKEFAFHTAKPLGREIPFNCSENSPGMAAVCSWTLQLCISRCCGLCSYVQGVSGAAHRWCERVRSTLSKSTTLALSHPLLCDLSVCRGQMCSC